MKNEPRLQPSFGCTFQNSPDNSETEQEALQIIANQQEKISELKAELKDKDLQFQQYEMSQNQQTETYKNQIVNLKS